VKEEKALLIAQESEEASTMLETIKSVIRACTFEKLDVDTLAVFDIEYIFCQLRARSVGEVVEPVFSCTECNDDKAKVQIPIDLTKLNVKFDPDHVSLIKLSDSVGVKMNYPGLAMLKKTEDFNAGNVELIFDIIVDSIEYIYDSDTVYASKEQSKEDLVQFIENLTQDQFAKIQSFFETMPKLEQDIKFDCPVCNHHHELVIKGLDSFF